VPRREPPGIAEHAHAGSPCRFDSIATVFDDGARGRADSQAGRRVKKEVRGGLAARDLGGTEDSTGEARIEPREPQRVPDALVGAARPRRPRSGPSRAGRARRRRPARRCAHCRPARRRSRRSRARRDRSWARPPAKRVERVQISRRPASGDPRTRCASA
jgi:hypothetical protein